MLTTSKHQKLLVDRLKAAIDQQSLELTELKRAEEALRESERLLNRVGGIAKIGGWEMDLEKGGRSTWTKETYDIFEIDPGDPIPGADEHVSWYAPEYREMIVHKMKDLIETKHPMQFEAMLKTKKWNSKWCQAIGEVVEENGKTLKIPYWASAQFSILRESSWGRTMPKTRGKAYASTA